MEPVVFYKLVFWISIGSFLTFLLIVGNHARRLWWYYIKYNTNRRNWFTEKTARHASTSDANYIQYSVQSDMDFIECCEYCVFRKTYLDFEEPELMQYRCVKTHKQVYLHMACPQYQFDLVRARI